MDDPIQDNPSEYYFPPLNNDSWESIDTDSLGWNQNALEDLKSYMVETNSRAVIILKEGKIAFEHYNGKNIVGQDFDADDIWYWASAGKTLTSFLVGIAQSDGLLDIEDSSSLYLGEGWTNMEPAQENNIKIKHQLTMTTGMDDRTGNSDCTDPPCLNYFVDPGERWSYHNAPYTRLDGIIEGATNSDFDSYFNQKLRNPIGMDGFWTYLDYNHVYWSTARSMARFGLLNLNEGNWVEAEIMRDKEYWTNMTNISQTLNKSYGYLWWLNGSPSYMIPGLQLVFPGSYAPTAPDDMYAGLGKNGQVVSIIPSEDLVIVRMGDNPDQSLVPLNFVIELMERIGLVAGF